MISFQDKNKFLLNCKKKDAKRKNKIYNMSKKIDFNNLPYKNKNKNLVPINFIRFIGPLNIYENVRNGNISIEKAIEDQKQFKSNLSLITSGDPKFR